MLVGETMDSKKLDMFSTDYIYLMRLRPKSPVHKLRLLESSTSERSNVSQLDSNQLDSKGLKSTHNRSKTSLWIFCKVYN
jgi:hypothetical protein